MEGFGANCSVCEVNGFRFAIDSGLHPKFAGKDAIPAINEIDRNSLDFIVLTHCHLDHLGSLPLLSREHPDAPVLIELSKFHTCPKNAFKFYFCHEKATQ